MKIINPKHSFCVFIALTSLINVCAQTDTSKSIQKSTNYAKKQLLPGQIPNFAIPIAYDFGHVSNIQVATDEEESTVSGGLNLYKYGASEDGDCEQCRTGNQIFARGKLSFADNQIKKGMELKNYYIELGHRWILPSSASYYTNDIKRKFKLEDTCSLYNFCDSWQNNRAFSLPLDYSYATERWIEAGLTWNNKKYNIVSDIIIENKSLQDYTLNVSYNFYRKYNQRILSDPMHRSRLRKLKFIGLKINAQVGIFDNIAQIDNLYAVDPSTNQVNGGILVYGVPQEILATSPNQAGGGKFFGILAVGFTDWLSLAVTPARIQAFESSISGITATSFRWDILLKLPKSEDCEGNWTHNITFGINCKYQQRNNPVYGFGASIPFED